LYSTINLVSKVSTFIVRRRWLELRHCWCVFAIRPRVVPAVWVWVCHLCNVWVDLK